jgi:hypothetical protein
MSYIINFDGVADRRALSRPLTLTYSPGTQYERQVPSRFTSIVDGANGEELAAVTGQYTLVQNERIVRAVERAGDTLGLNLRRDRALYRSGKSEIRWTLPDNEFRPSGAGSPMVPGFIAGNDYRGSAALTGEGWIGVLLCTNGMRRTEWMQTARRVHKGEISDGALVQMYGILLKGTIDRVAEQEAAIEAMARKEATDEQVEALIKSIGTRQARQDLVASAVRSNMAAHGQTVWALAQAVTEVQTHDLPTGWAGQDWAARQVEALIQSAMVVA